MRTFLRAITLLRVERAGEGTRCHLLLAILCVLVPKMVFGSDPMPYFLLVGQSNMTGADSEISDSIPGKSPLDDAVLFWNYSAWGGKDWHIDKQMWFLRPQTTGGYCKDVIGPEYGFTRALRAKNQDRPLSIVKVSFPGSDLAVDWRKENPGGQRCYTHLQDVIEAYRKELAKCFAKPRLDGILVHQGISDAHDGNGLKAEEKAEAYEANLRKFIGNLRSDFGAADTPVVLARENMSPHSFVKPECMKSVRETIVNVAKTTPRTRWIDVDGLERVKGHHFTAQSQMEIGRRYAQSYLEIVKDDQISSKPMKTK